MKILSACLIVFLLSTNIAYSQIGKTKSEIIKIEGRKHMEVELGNVTWMVFKKKGKDKKNGKYRYTLDLKVRGTDGKCFDATYFYEGFDCSDFEKEFDKKFQKTEDNTWIDKEGNILYKIEVLGNLCILSLVSLGDL